MNLYLKDTKYGLFDQSDILFQLLTSSWLCLTSHQQRGHLETAPPFTVPCEGREAR